jgi:Pel9A-like, right handed beta helix region
MSQPEHSALVQMARFLVAVLGGSTLCACGSDDGAGAESGGPSAGGFATGGGVASGGTLPAGGGGTGSAVTPGGTSSAGGVMGAGGAGGTTAAGGAAGNNGAGGASLAGGATSAGGTLSAGGTSSTGGTSTGTGGKACHSTDDWTPKSGDIWISPGGSDSDDGTEGSPKEHLTAAVSAWSSGKTIWVTPGTYVHGAPIVLSTSATSSGPLRISGVMGGAKPVFDFSSEPRATNNNGQRGFQISGDYVHLRYLEIGKAADNCVYVTGSNNTLEWLSVHECQDTGVQVSNGAANNKILNVDSYLNADPTGENADGFAPKLSIGQNNYFCGDRSFQNSDDGYDCWSAGDGSPVTFEYCWAFGQPGPTGTSASDGNGFKLGSPSTLASGGNAPHTLVDCFAFHNKGSGFTANGNSSGQITCTNCGVWNNGTPWSAGTGGVVPQHTGDITNLNVTVDQAMNAPRDASGDLPDITRL